MTRPMFIARAILAVVVSLPTAALAQETTAAQPTRAYPDSAAGLKRLVKDILAAVKANKEQALTSYVNSLLIPQPEAWFPEIFGEEQGRRFAEAYAKRRNKLPHRLSEVFSSALREKRTDVEVLRYEEPCDLEASADQYPILLLRKHPVPFYEVQMLHEDQGKALWFFAYVRGAFRYVGDKGVTFSPEPSGAAGSARIGVSGKVQHTRLIEQKAPEYPDKAKAAYIQGTVRFRAVIATDGTVRDLELVEGHCWLAEAAIKAVSQWRYQPTRLEGQPVEVTTTIDVVFTLSR